MQCFACLKTSTGYCPNCKTVTFCSEECSTVHHFCAAFKSVHESSATVKKKAKTSAQCTNVLELERILMSGHPPGHRLRRFLDFETLKRLYVSSKSLRASIRAYLVNLVELNMAQAQDFPVLIEMILSGQLTKVRSLNLVGSAYDTLAFAQRFPSLRLLTLSGGDPDTFNAFTAAGLAALSLVRKLTIRKPEYFTEDIPLDLFWDMPNLKELVLTLNELDITPSSFYPEGKLRLVNIPFLTISHTLTRLEIVYTSRENEPRELILDDLPNLKDLRLHGDPTPSLAKRQVYVKKLQLSNLPSLSHLEIHHLTFSACDVLRSTFLTKFRAVTYASFLESSVDPYYLSPISTYPAFQMSSVFPNVETLRIVNTIDTQIWVETYPFDADDLRALKQLKELDLSGWYNIQLTDDLLNRDIVLVLDLFPTAFYESLPDNTVATLRYNPFTSQKLRPAIARSYGTRQERIGL